VGLERIFQLDQMQDVGFALPTGHPRRCPSLHQVGAWRRHVPWTAVDPAYTGKFVGTLRRTFFERKGDLYCTPKALIVYLEEFPEQEWLSSTTSISSMPSNIASRGLTTGSSSYRSPPIAAVLDPDIVFLMPRAKRPFGASEPNT